MSMEWLILVLLVPAIVVPAVLLWGFCGCTVLFQPGFSRAFEATLEPGPPEIDLQQRTIVLRIAPSPTLLRGGSRVRITLRGSSVNSLRLERVFISQAADPPGDPYDSAPEAPLTPVAASVDLPEGKSVTLDEVSYELDPFKSLLIAFDVGSALKFGARVRVVGGPADGVAVRAGPDGNFRGRQPEGTEGTIIGGPGPDMSGQTWWEVDFDEGVDGWVREESLALAGDVYFEGGVPADVGRLFHREDLAEAGVADRQPSAANPGDTYHSLGSIYLLERIDVAS
jgi:hypothetical protein